MAEDGPPAVPPNIDLAELDDKNLETGDLSQAWGLLGQNRFILRKDHKEVEAYFVEDLTRRVRGEVRWVQNGGWAVQAPGGEPLAMLWRQHTEDHPQAHLGVLVHRGFRRYEEARRNEEDASIYCLADLDRTVRLFVTMKGNEAILDSPSQRPVLKMARGPVAGDVALVDAFDEPVANIHSERTAFIETHDITLLQAADPFRVVLFAAIIGMEMGLRHGTWRSPYAGTEL